MSENSAYLANAPCSRGQQRMQAKPPGRQQSQQPLGSKQSVKSSSTYIGPSSSPAHQVCAAPPTASPLGLPASNTADRAYSQLDGAHSQQHATTHHEGPTPATSGSKPKQPYLQKGSGLKLRLAAAKERKYVPKGGFLLKFDGDAASADSSADSTATTATASARSAAGQGSRLADAARAHSRGLSDDSDGLGASPWRVNAYAAALDDQDHLQGGALDRYAAHDPQHWGQPMGSRRHGASSPVPHHGTFVSDMDAVDSPLGGSRAHVNPLAASHDMHAGHAAASDADSWHGGQVELESDTTLVDIPGAWNAASGMHAAASAAQPQHYGSSQHTTQAGMLSETAQRDQLHSHAAVHSRQGSFASSAGGAEYAAAGGSSTPVGAPAASPVPPGSRFRSTAEWAALKAEEEMELEEFRALERQIGCEPGDLRSSMRTSVSRHQAPASAVAHSTSKTRPATASGGGVQPQHMTQEASSRPITAPGPISDAAWPARHSPRSSVSQHSSGLPPLTGPLQQGPQAHAVDNAMPVLHVAFGVTADNSLRLDPQQDISSWPAVGVMRQPAVARCSHSQQRELSACPDDAAAVQPDSHADRQGSAQPHVVWSNGHTELEFDDQAEWDSASVSFARSTGTEGGTPSRSRATGLLRSSNPRASQATSHAEPAQATSTLMQQLFHQHHSSTSQPVADETGCLGPASAQQPRPAAEQERSAALEAEVQRFQQERAKVDKLKTQLEHAIGRMEQEKIAFERRKAEEVAAWEKEREVEAHRLKRDRRVLEKQSRAILKLPNRKERGEVEALEAVLEQERKSGKAKEARHKLTVERLRRQIVELQDKNTELREEVRWHEAQRLKQWEGKPQSASKSNADPGAGFASADGATTPAPQHVTAHIVTTAGAQSSGKDQDHHVEAAAQAGAVEHSAPVQHAQHAQQPQPHAQPGNELGDALLEWQRADSASGPQADFSNERSEVHTGVSQGRWQGPEWAQLDQASTQPLLQQQHPAAPAGSYMQQHAQQSRLPEQQAVSPHEGWSQQAALGQQWSLSSLAEQRAPTGNEHADTQKAAPGQQWGPSGLAEQRTTSAHAGQRAHAPNAALAPQWGFSSCSPPAGSSATASATAVRHHSQPHSSLGGAAVPEGAGGSGMQWPQPSTAGAASCLSEHHAAAYDAVDSTRHDGVQHRGRPDAQESTSAAHGAHDRAVQQQWYPDRQSMAAPDAQLATRAAHNTDCSSGQQGYARSQSTAAGSPFRPALPDWMRSHDGDAMQWASPDRPARSQDRALGSSIVGRRISPTPAFVSPGRAPPRSLAGVLLRDSTASSSGAATSMHGQQATSSGACMHREGPRPPTGTGFTSSHPPGSTGAAAMYSRSDAHALLTDDQLSSAGARCGSQAGSHASSRNVVQKHAHGPNGSPHAGIAPAETRTSLAQLQEAADLASRHANTAAVSHQQTAGWHPGVPAGLHSRAEHAGAATGPGPGFSALSGLHLDAFEQQLREYENGLLGKAAHHQDPQGGAAMSQATSQHVGPSVAGRQQCQATGYAPAVQASSQRFEPGVAQDQSLMEAQSNHAWRHPARPGTASHAMTAACAPAESSRQAPAYAFNHDITRQQQQQQQHHQQGNGQGVRRSLEQHYVTAEELGGLQYHSTDAATAAATAARQAGGGHSTHSAHATGGIHSVSAVLSVAAPAQAGGGHSAPANGHSAQANARVKSFAAASLVTAAAADPDVNREAGTDRPSDGVSSQAGSSTAKPIQEMRYPDGKVEHVYGSGRRSVTFANGTVKEQFPDGSSAIRFTNGDIKKMLKSGRVEYYYAEVDTWQTTHPDGIEVFYFPNGQTEAHHPGGMKEILFPDRVIRRVYPDGREQEAAAGQLSSAVKQPRPSAGSG